MLFILWSRQLDVGHWNVLMETKHAYLLVSCYVKYLKLINYYQHFKNSTNQIGLGIRFPTVLQYDHLLVQLSKLFDGIHFKDLVVLI